MHWKNMYLIYMQIKDSGICCNVQNFTPNYMCMCEQCGRVPL